jgi:hypothetical protein
MKTINFLAAAIGVLLISTTGFAGNILSQGDDTIRIKTQDNSEMIIIVNSYGDIENLDAEMDAVMNSLEDVFIQIEGEMDGMDSVINVTVKNIDDEIIVDIQGIEEDEEKNLNLNFNINDEPKTAKKLHAYFSYDLGMNNYLENGKFPNDVNAQYSVKPWGSWYFGIGGGLRWYVAKPFSVDLGADFSWYNYKYQDRSTRVTKTDDDIIFSADAAGAEYINSKTAVPYLNISVTPMIHFGKENSGVNHKDFRIGAGVYAGYRLGGSVKYVYNLNDIHMKYRTQGDYFLNTYRYGVKAVFGYQDINFFATYDLSTLYAEGKGPELNPICFGLNWTF